MDVFTRRIVGFGVAAADLDGPAICRMFNHVIAKQTLSKYISSDHDPLFRFQRWRANLRILEVDEIKAVPCAPRSKSSTTTTAVIPDWPEPPRLIGAAFPPRPVHNLSPIPGGPISTVYFRPQSPPELEFATDS